MSLFVTRKAEFMGESALNQENDPLAIEGLEGIFDQPMHEVIEGHAHPVQAVSWTLAQAAKELKVSLVTVRRRLQTGKLKGFKVEGLNGPEWRVVPAEQTDSAQAVHRVTENQPHPVQTVINYPDHSLVADHLDVIREMQGKLEALTYRNGYLEAQLENQREQIRLLTDGQQKNRGWSRFWSWFVGR